VEFFNFQFTKFFYGAHTCAPLQIRKTPNRIRVRAIVVVVVPTAAIQVVFVGVGTPISITAPHVVRVTVTIVRPCTS